MRDSAKGVAIGFLALGVSALAVCVMWKIPTFFNWCAKICWGETKLPASRHSELEREREYSQYSRPMRENRGSATHQPGDSASR